MDPAEHGPARATYHRTGCSGRGAQLFGYCICADCAIVGFQAERTVSFLEWGGEFGRLGNLPEDLFTEDGAGQGLFNLLVQVDPVNPAVVYAGGVELWKSTDFGSNWENLSALKNLHEDPRAIIFEPSDPRTFYLTGDSGVWRSSDGGATFGHLNQTLAITQFQSVGLHPSNPGLAVGGTQDNGTALYTGSSIWEQGRPGDSGAAFYDRANPETLYTVARRHSLRRSDDGGASFQLIAEGLDITDRVLFYPPFLADPSQSSTLYFATHRLWRSQNRGDQWQSVSGDLTGGGSATISSVAVAPSDPAVIYAGTSDARVQVSHDQGQTWTLAAELPNRFVTSIAIDPLLPQRVIAAVSGFGTGHVFLSENFGAGWEDISGNLPDIPVNTVLMDASSPETVYAGTDIGVFVRLPDGAWSPLLDGMPNAIVLGLSQNPATGLLVAATHGRGTFAIATGGPAGNFPRMDALTNGASFELAPVVPGMVAALFGENLASVTQNVEGPLPLPFSLGGTTVWVDDVPAPLFFVSPGQINFQIPYGLGNAVSEVKVRTEAGEARMTLPRADAKPGIYQGGGQAAILLGDGALVSELSPAQPGEVLVLYANGLGEVDPGVESGTAAPIAPLAQTIFQPAVHVGGVAAEVQFSGLTPGFAGLYQVNFVVPDGVSGSLSTTVSIDSSVSASVLLYVIP